MPKTGRRSNGRSPIAQTQVWKIRWLSLPGPEALGRSDLVSECILLFSEHYGRWGPGGPVPGGPVRISAKQLSELLGDPNAQLSCAFADDELVGYCVAARAIDVPGRGRVDWVSQLVVHETFRNARIATQLLFSVWQFSDSYAWGLVTANPFAVRALESATRRPCRAGLITSRGPAVLAAVSEHVGYLPPAPVENPEGALRPRVNTNFHVDHEDVPRMQQQAARGDRPWSLGSLPDGEEWLAMTFCEQEQQALDREHLTDLLTGSDGIWVQAYEGMTLDERHTWHSHAESEIATVLEAFPQPLGASVVDVGCGDGRHVELLADAGLSVLGVDISPRLIALAEERNVETKHARVALADAREGVPARDADLILCLYDVIGSSASPDDDLALLRAMRAASRPGAGLVLSVMNTAVTFDRIAPEQRPEDDDAFLAALQRLPPSSTMESTGSVFDPDKLLVYRGVYYRKEQFRAADWALPSELVVRDRRFEVAQIKALVEQAGYTVREVRPVQSGRWDRVPVLAPEDDRAKELLVFATAA